MESRALKGFVLELEAQRRQARALAIAALGVTERQAASEFAALVAPGRVGQTYERAGKRFAVLAELASVAPPVLPLGVQGKQLHPLDERPRVHGVPILVCGEGSCARVLAPRLPAVHALGIELSPGEELGAPLLVSYDYWWAQVSYDRPRACPAPTAESRPARAAGR